MVGDEELLKKSYYAIIPANVRYDDRLSMGARFMYGEITALCNEKGYCWASNKYFATLYNVAERTIQRWISDLIKCGYVFSDVKYKMASKEIEARYLKLLNGIHSLTIPPDNIVTTPTTKMSPPHDKNVVDNNTCEYINVLSKDNTCQKDDKFDYNNFIELYNSICTNFPKAIKMTDDRRKKINLRLKTYPKEKWWNKVFTKANISDFCKKGNWCNLDWFISNDTNPLKVYEGKYDNKEQKNDGTNKYSTDYSKGWR